MSLFCTFMFIKHKNCNFVFNLNYFIHGERHLFFALLLFILYTTVMHAQDFHNNRNSFGRIESNGAICKGSSVKLAMQKMLI